MIKQLLSLLCLGLIVGWAAPVDADVIFDVDSSTGTSVTAGDTPTLTFFIEANGADLNSQADAYQLTFEVTAFGGASIGDLDFTSSVPAVAPGSPFSLLNPPVQFNTFTIAGAAFPAAVLGARTDLFTMDFTVAGGATALGGYNFDIIGVDQTGNFPTKLELGGVALNPDYSASPELSLSYNQIPEPTGLGMLLIGLVGISTTRRRRKAA